MQQRQIILGLGMALVAGAWSVPNALASGGGGPVAVSILGSGSDTTQFMMDSLDRLYLFSPGCAQIPTPSGPTAWLDFSCQSPDPSGTVTTENYAHDQTHEAYFLGSSNGISQLCNQGGTIAGAPVAHIDFARSSRASKISDCSGLDFVAYALDGISWEAFNSTGSGVHAISNQAGTCAGSGSGGASPYCLSQSQLQGIFLTCTITNWSQVGGQNVAINPYTPQPGSGTRSTFDSFLGGSSDTCINKRGTPYAAKHIIPENANTVIKANKDQTKAIFPFSFGIFNTQVKGIQKNWLLGAIDNVSPSQTTISNGSFPYTRDLYNVLCSACSSGHQSSTQTFNYVGPDGWICKNSTLHANDPVTGLNYRTEIANAITANGFVPIPFGAIGGGDLNSGYCRLSTT
jgi:ABC-type phosphate transport system substrate-binding protein